MVHRGPDENGELISPQGAPSISLGMRRLSIIDLPGGSQPIFNERKDVAVVYNGEIYNFIELRRELLALGHTFRTNSDTEVIVHGYEQWGASSVSRLRGMFALAVLDMRVAPNVPPRILLARDRLGIKPLYYALHNGIFLFASEVRALLAAGVLPEVLSVEALESFLLFGSVAEPETLISGVSSLPPGHLLEVTTDCCAGSIEPSAYWIPARAVSQSQKEPPSTVQQAAKMVRPILDDAIERHLIADVELGAFLSSGLDSTAISAIASRKRAHLRTFTLTFQEEEFSEAALSREIARRLGTRHEEILLRGDDVAARLDEAVSALDQPSMDGINTYFVSWAAHRVGLKVALSGLGGDEIFGGYSTFAAVPSATRAASVSRRLPRALRSATASAVGRAGAKEADARRKLSSLWTDSTALPHAYFFTRLLFSPQQALHIRGDTWKSSPKSRWLLWATESVRLSKKFDAFSAVSCLEMRSYMAQTLLRDTDSVSMANSLEVRVPLLDHVLVESVLGLPSGAKSRAGLSKAVLVEALGDILPLEVIQQRKRTFTLPWEAWLRGPLATKMRDALSNVSPVLLPYIDKKAVRNVWTDFEAGRTNWSRPWSLFVLNEWCSRHVARSERSMAE